MAPSGAVKTSPMTIARTRTKMYIPRNSPELMLADGLDKSHNDGNGVEK